MIGEGRLGALLLATAVSLAPASSRAEGDATFTVVDLGTLGGQASTATGINAFGEIVGWSDAAGGTRHAFLWTPWSGMIDLGTLGERSHPVALTPFGQVAGWSELPGRTARHAFSWTWWEGLIDLGTLGGTNSEPAPARSEDEASSPGVNASGQVVGTSDLAGDGAHHAFSWTRRGGMVDLGTLGGANSAAVAVNALGQVVGVSETADAGPHAFSWTRRGGMVDLGTLGGAQSEAAAVNDRGQVVGWSTLAGETERHAFLWTRAGGMIDLGTLGGRVSTAMFVTDLGQVFGESFDATYGLPHAFVWTRANGMSDLMPSGSYTTPVAVNAIGQVAGLSAWRNEVSFFWSRETGALSISGAGWSLSRPTAINVFGQVVGCTQPYVAPYTPVCAYSWTKRGGALNLAPLEAGMDACALAVGPTGVVVGVSGTRAGPHAVAWIPRCR